MKPKNLKYPFSWEERKPTIFDRVFFVPEYFHDYQSFSFPNWNDKEIFGNDLPVLVEYCSGNGTWIAEKALKNPEFNWVAIEKKFERARKIWSKIKNFNISNLFVICGEGLITTKNYFPENTLSEVFINFPDPWPKNRHAKNRLINNNFVFELSRVLKEGGKLSIVTDDISYSEEIILTLGANSDFKSLNPDPFFTTEVDNYGHSYFENLWKSLGKVIRYHQYHKTF